MATLLPEEMTKALIGTEDLAQTFKKLEEDQDEDDLSQALAEVARVQEHMPKVVTCLRAVVDPFPKKRSNVNELVDYTLYYISDNTRDTESFAKVITSFEPSDAKPLLPFAIDPSRKDTRNVLESVMDQSPKLITGDLPRWLANHDLIETLELHSL